MFRGRALVSGPKGEGRLNYLLHWTLSPYTIKFHNTKKNTNISTNKRTLCVLYIDAKHINMGIRINHRNLDTFVGGPLDQSPILPFLSPKHFLGPRGFWGGGKELKPHSSWPGPGVSTLLKLGVGKKGLFLVWLFCLLCWLTLNWFPSSFCEGSCWLLESGPMVDLKKFTASFTSDVFILDLDFLQPRINKI